MYLWIKEEDKVQDFNGLSIFLFVSLSIVGVFYDVAILRLLFLAV